MTAQLATLRASVPRRGSVGASSLGLIAAKLTQMATGFVFWILVARLAAVAEVGVVSAAVAGVLLCTQLGTLGTGSAVIACVGRGEDPRAVLDGVATILIAASLTVAACFLVVSSYQDGETALVTRSPFFAAVFLVAVVAGGAQIVLDQAGVALRRSASTSIRYALGGAAALVATAAVGLADGSPSASVLFLAWTAGALAVGLVGVVQVRRWTGSGLRPSFSRAASRRLLGVGMPNQALTLTERVPALVVPVLVAYVVSPETAALWYPAWMMAWTAYSAPVLVGIAQFAEGVRSPLEQRRTVRSGIGWSLLVGGGIAVVLGLAAEPLLGLMGPTYAESSATALRLLAVGIIPFSVVQAFNASCRARGRLGEAIWLGGLQCAAICATTVAVAGHGPTAIALAWLSCSVVAGLWAGVRIRAVSPDV